MADEWSPAWSMKTSYPEIPWPKSRQLYTGQFLLYTQYLNEYLPTMWSSNTVPNNINSKSWQRRPTPARPSSSGGHWEHVRLRTIAWKTQSNKTFQAEPRTPELLASVDPNHILSRADLPSCAAFGLNRQFVNSNSSHLTSSSQQTIGRHTNRNVVMPVTIITATAFAKERPQGTTATHSILTHAYMYELINS